MPASIDPALLRLAELGTAARGVAHDFSNLLLVMREQLAMASEDLPRGHSATKAIDTAREAIRQSQELVDTLAMMARGAKASSEPLDLGATVEETVHFLRSIAPKSVRVVSDVQIEPRVQVVADPVGLHRVLVNLATNGFEAMPRGGTLTISLSEQPAACGASEAHLRVSDTGAGMSPCAMARMFEPFYTSKNGHRCSGLGLPVVREIIATHGGRLDVRSDCGKGTVVSVIMPVRRANSGSAKSGRTASASRPTSRVLVVGRDRRVRTRVNAALMSAGFHVLWVPGGPEALFALGRRGHDIQSLVVDLDSTAPTDLSLLAERHDWCGTRGAVLLQGRSSPEAATRSANRTVLLRKPFAPLDLASCVDRLINPSVGGCFS